MWQIHSEHHIHWESIKSFPCKIRSKTNANSFVTSVELELGVSSESNETRKSHKGHPQRKGESKM